MLKELIKEVLKDEIIGNNTNKSEKVGSPLDQRFVGKTVMVRTYSAGVHFGVLVEKAGQQVILNDSRRVYYWTKACSLSQLAIEGSGDIKSCKIAMTVPEILLDRVIEVIPMSVEAIRNLQGSEVWKI